MAVRLRTLLVLTVLGITASFVVFGGWLLLSLWDRQREIVDRQNVEFARAVSVAVDQQVENSIASLSVLAALDVLDSGDLGRFQELARRAIPRQAGWHAVLLADASGVLLTNTAGFFPNAPTTVPTDWVPAVVETLRPTVSNLITDPGVPGSFFTVAVPVIRGGALRYVLGVRIRSEALGAIVHEQQMPPDGVVTLIDRNRIVMARSRGERDFVGKPPSPGFLRAASEMTEGSWREVLLEGTPAYAALSRSDLTGWTVGVGVPMEEIDAPIRRWLWSLASAGLFVLVAGAGAAVLFARAVIPPLTQASTAVHALALGETMPATRSPIVEIRQLFGGLRRAEVALHERLRERDEAERGRLEASVAREEALQAEQAARRSAEAAGRVKDEFLMAMSHELRTPVSAIIGWARMLHTDQVRPEQRPRAIETIERNAHALMRLLDDLLDMSRYASGRMRLDIAIVEIGPLIRAAVDSILPSAAAKGIEIRSRVPRVGSILADGDRLQQVVWNLLSNAVKFTPSGGHIDITLEQQRDGAVHLAVADTGPGIEPELLPHVFEPFRQGPHAGRARVDGLGLGLAIVRHLVEMHGGTVRAENNLAGRGATFYVVLPASTASPPAAGTV
jgi:signal transduction histidine kinase